MEYVCSWNNIQTIGILQPLSETLSEHRLHATKKAFPHSLLLSFSLYIYAFMHLFSYSHEIYDLVKRAFDFAFYTLFLFLKQLIESLPSLINFAWVDSLCELFWNYFSCSVEHDFLVDNFQRVILLLRIRFDYLSFQGKLIYWNRNALFSTHYPQPIKSILLVIQTIFKTNWTIKGIIHHFGGKYQNA